MRLVRTALDDCPATREYVYVRADLLATRAECEYRLGMWARGKAAFDTAVDLLRRPESKRTVGVRAVRYIACLAGRMWGAGADPLHCRRLLEDTIQALERTGARTARLDCVSISRG